MVSALDNREAPLTLKINLIKSEAQRPTRVRAGRLGHHGCFRPADTRSERTLLPADLRSFYLFALYHGSGDDVPTRPS